MNHVPRGLRADAIQAAWLAVAEGTKPDSAVRKLLRREARHRAVRPNFDLCPTSRVRRWF